MHLKNSLQKAADGCIRNRKETHCPENSAFPGFCDYEVMKMNILGTDYELIKECDELVELNVDGEKHCCIKNFLRGGETLTTFLT